MSVMKSNKPEKGEDTFNAASSTASEHAISAAPPP
jgi:hypothetical protein